MAVTNASLGELGDFLRSRRERLNPTALKITSSRRRRTPGLRREELAELAGIGVDWYIRLEQGRAVSPSPTTIDALAKAMRLTKAEHAHLRTLAQKPGAHHAKRAAFTRETVPLTVQHVLRGMRQPAYITGRRWDVLAWNAAADKLFGFSRHPEAERNIILGMLTDPGTRKLFGGAWAQEAQRMVAEFRASYDQWAGDPAFVELLARLRKDSPEFNLWWEAHDVRNVASGRKALIHPSNGSMHFEYASFQANDDPALKLVVYVAQDDADVSLAGRSRAYA